MTTCPVCERRVAAVDADAIIARCECGYDFAARDASFAIDKLRTARTAARHKLLRGSGALLTTLPMIAYAHALPMAIVVVLGFIVPAQLYIGVKSLIEGTRERQRAIRQLRTARTLGQLPAARVVSE